MRTLQEFLAQHRRDEDALRQRLMEIVRDEQIKPAGLGLVVARNVPDGEWNDASKTRSRRSAWTAMKADVTWG